MQYIAEVDIVFYSKLFDLISIVENTYKAPGIEKSRELHNFNKVSIYLYTDIFTSFI